MTSLNCCCYVTLAGILIGTLTMEYGGKVSIECEKTGYKAELEFKLKPFLGMGEASNRVTGKLKLGDETLASVDGKWDQEIHIKDKRTEVIAATAATCSMTEPNHCSINSNL